MKKYFLAVFLMALTGGMMTSCGDDDTSEYDGYKTVTDDEKENDSDTTVVVRDTLAVKALERAIAGEGVLRHLGQVVRPDNVPF